MVDLGPSTSNDFQQIIIRSMNVVTIGCSGCFFEMPFPSKLLNKFLIKKLSQKEAKINGMYIECDGSSNSDHFKHTPNPLEFLCIVKLNHFAGYINFVLNKMGWTTTKLRQAHNDNLADLLTYLQFCLMQ